LAISSATDVSNVSAVSLLRPSLILLESLLLLAQLLLNKFLLLITVSAFADDPAVVIDPAAVVVPVLAVVLKIKHFVSPTNVHFFFYRTINYPTNDFENLSDYCVSQKIHLAKRIHSPKSCRSRQEKQTK
jgi:hypothetical protein